MFCLFLMMLMHQCNGQKISFKIKIKSSPLPGFELPTMDPSVKQMAHQCATVLRLSYEIIKDYLVPNIKNNDCVNNLLM